MIQGNFQDTSVSFKLVATMQSFTCVRCKYQSKLNYGILKKLSISTQFPAFTEGYIFVVCWFTENSEGNQTVLKSVTEKRSIVVHVIDFYCQQV